MLSGEVTGDIESLIETSAYLSKRTTREQSEDSIQKQLGAFERLLQHAMSRFSKENLYHVLRHVTRWKEGNQRPTHKHATKVAFKLQSVSHLKDITKEMRGGKAKKTQEEERIFKNYELFLNDLLYLRDLKKYFDDEIHRALMKYHYDAAIVKPRTPHKGTKYKMKTGRYVKVEDEDSGHGSPPAEAETEAGAGKQKPAGNKAGNKSPADTGSRDPASSEAEKKYRETVSELNVILDRWGRLLSEETPDLNDFDPDSYHELMQFSNYSQFETLLRLIPDIFAKCYKCIELAKAWLKQSNIVLQDIPYETSSPIPVSPEHVNASEKEKQEEQTQQTTKEMLKNIRELQNQIVNIEQGMEEDEHALDTYNDEMDSLAAREERFDNVTSDFNMIDSRITLAAGHYQKSKTEQVAVANKLRGFPKNSPAYVEMKSQLKRLDTEVLHNHCKMKVLQLQKATITEDYLVELHVRPEFIRFEGDTQEKIADLKRFLEAKREDKLRFEKQLALAKTNTERMKKIMNTYLGSHSEVMADPSDATSGSRNAWAVNYNEDVTADGNEADIDSPIQNDAQSVSRNSSRPSTGENKSLSGNSSRPSTGESAILQKPKLVKKVRDLRPSSEGPQKEVETKPTSPNVMAKLTKMPKASLKSSPRRVWENF